MAASAIIVGDIRLRAIRSTCTRASVGVREGYLRVITHNLMILQNA